MNDISITQTSDKLYTLITLQDLKCKKKELWKFISNPHNLKLITPTDLGFEITTPGLRKEIFDNLRIQYKVQPLFGFKMTWVSKITNIIPEKEFTDQQISGPFVVWSHRHIIEPISKGKVCMKDIVEYQLPFGRIGKVLGEHIVKTRLKEIFQYRKEKIDLFFNNTN